MSSLDYLFSKYQPDDEYRGTPNQDKIQLEKQGNRMDIKYKSQYEDIIGSIQRNILKCKCKIKKKYVIRNTHMYLKIAKYIEENKLNVECEFVSSETEKTKHLEYIDGMYDSRCCPDCDKPMEFWNDRVSLKYIEITYQRSFE